MGGECITYPSFIVDVSSFADEQRRNVMIAIMSGNVERCKSTLFETIKYHDNYENHA